MAWLVHCALLVLLATSAVGLDNGLALTPPMGWNTWCTLERCGYDLCTASEIMNIADAMSTNGMRELGYEYINLDDCWANYRDENGTIVPDKSRFPDGLVPVIEYINSKGLKFGLVKIHCVYMFFYICICVYLIAYSLTL
jgi:alpha-galactosidase